MEYILSSDVVEYCLLPYLSLDDVAVNFTNYLSYEVERRTILGSREGFQFAQEIGDDDLMQIAFDSWIIIDTNDMYRYCLEYNW